MFEDVTGTIVECSFHLYIHGTAVSFSVSNSQILHCC